MGESFRSWSLRYLKEAKVDFSLASEASVIETVKYLSTIALRKAQLSIQYALGQPEYLDIAVSEYLVGEHHIDEPMIMLLGRIRRLTQEISEPQSKLTKKTIIEKTSMVVDVASKLVGEFLRNNR